MSSGSYYEEEMSSGGHRRLTAFILWPFSPSKKSPLDPPSPWGWLGAYVCLGYNIRKLFSFFDGKGKTDYWIAPADLEPEVPKKANLKRLMKKQIIGQNEMLRESYKYGKRAAAKL